MFRPNNYIPSASSSGYGPADDPSRIGSRKIRQKARPVHIILSSQKKTFKQKTFER